MTLAEFYAVVKDTLKLLSQLACDGLLNSGHEGIPRLIFDKTDFEKIHAGNSEGKGLTDMGAVSPGLITLIPTSNNIL